MKGHERFVMVNGRDELRLLEMRVAMGVSRRTMVQIGGSTAEGQGIMALLRKK